MELLSTKEAAERLGVSERRVLAMIYEGKIEATRVGRDYVIPGTSLDGVVTYGKAGRPPKPKDEAESAIGAADSTKAKVARTAKQAKKP